MQKKGENVPVISEKTVDDMREELEKTQPEPGITVRVQLGATTVGFKVPEIPIIRGSLETLGLSGRNCFQVGDAQVGIDIRRNR